MTIGCLQTGMSIENLIDTPAKCIKFIMELTHVNKRTAYDYYNALLYINHHSGAYRDYIFENTPFKK